MKVAAMFGDGTGGVVDKPEPKPVGNWAVVKVHVTPMCTEYKGFKNGGEGDGFGHEAAGEVVEVAQPGRVRIGDRVVVQPAGACGRCDICHSGEYIHCQGRGRQEDDPRPDGGYARYAQYLVQQDWLLSPIPDDVSYKHGGLAVCGVGPTFGAMQQLNVDAHDTVMITGLGPVGLGGVINGVYRGARVIGVESHPYRANLAKELGAEAVIDPTDENALEQVMELTDGVGVDKAIDCSGASQAHRLMVDALRRKGEAAFVGEGGEFPLAASRDMIRKGIVLRGNWHYNLADYGKLIDMVGNVGDQLDKFITHEYAMSDVQSAWEQQITGNCGKVLLNPWA